MQRIQFCVHFSQFFLYLLQRWHFSLADLDNNQLKHLPVCPIWVPANQSIHTCHRHHSSCPELQLKLQISCNVLHPACSSSLEERQTVKCRVHETLFDKPPENYLLFLQLYGKSWSWSWSLHPGKKKKVLGCFCSFAGLDVCSPSALVKLHFFACLVS